MESHLPLVTAMATGVLVLMQLFLMFLVGNKRLSYGQGLGDGGHQDLLLAIRRHGNLAENAALFLVALGLLEILIGSTLTVVLIAAAFVVVRIAHAVGLSLGDGPNAARFIGAFGTLVTMSGTAI